MDNNKSKVLLSLLAGATAGVVAGLLLAPDSGKKSRATLMSSASKWGGDFDKIFRDGLGRLQEMSGKLTGMMGESGEGGKSSGADDMFYEMAGDGSSDAGSRGGRKSGGTSGSGNGSRSGSGTSSMGSSSNSGSGSMDSGSGSMGGSSMGSGSMGGSDTGSMGGSRSNPGTSPS